MKINLRLLGLLSCLLFVGQSYAQLTIQESVLGQYRQFSPESYKGLTWLADTKEMTYFSARYDAIMRISTGELKGKEWVSLDDVNVATKADFPHLYGSVVNSESEIILKGSSAYYAYNPQDKSAKKILGFPQTAENLTIKNDYLAYTIKNNLYLAHGGQTKIPVTKFQDGNIVSGQAIARSEFGITNGIFWSPNGSNLAFYQKDESEVANYPLLDITTTPGELNSIKYPMAGQKSEHARVGIYNIKNKSTVYLKLKGDIEQYLTNLSWSPDDKYVFIAIVNRDQNQMRWVQFDATTGERVNILYSEKHPKYVEPEHPLWFIPGSNTEYLMLSEVDGFMHIYKGSVIREEDERESRHTQLTTGKYVVLDILGLDYKKKNVIIHTTDESGLNTVVRSVPLKGGEAITVTKHTGQHRVKLNPNGRLILDTYSNLETPSVQQVIDVKGKLVGKPITQSNNPYSKGQLGTTTLSEIKAEDGTILQTRMIKPSNFDPNKKYPVLVYVYGGPHAQMVKNNWLGGASLWMHYMAQRGYIIWTVDNRGSANRGRDFENVIHRQLGVIEMQDQMTGVKHLKSLPYIDSDRMAVHGWSFGGFMTTSLMLRQPGVFKAGVAGGPVTDWSYYEIMYGERYMDRPEENAEGYADAKLHKYVKNLQGDLLLIHGTVDDVVVMQHNLSLVKAFVDAGIQMDFFPYPNHPHNVRGKDRVHLMQKVLDYVEKSLGTK